MKLPKIEHPTSEITVPTTGKIINFRPFLVKEEKILLMARETKSKKEALKSIKQVVNNCAIDVIDVDSLQIVDIEYIFLQLRAISVNNIIELAYRDNEDGKEYKFSVNIEDIKIVKPKKKVSNKIKINDKTTMVMRHCDGDTIDKIGEFKNESDMLMFYIKNCLTEVVIDETVYPAAEIEEASLDEFIDSMSSKTLEKIKDFFANTPKLEHIIEYTNSKGSERRIVLDTLEDFFTLV